MGNNERDQQEQAERARQEQEQEMARMREQQVVGENETANNPVIINK